MLLPRLSIATVKPCRALLPLLGCTACPCPVALRVAFKSYARDNYSDRRDAQRPRHDVREDSGDHEYPRFDRTYKHDAHQQTGYRDRDYERRGSHWDGDRRMSDRGFPRTYRDGDREGDRDRGSRRFDRTDRRDRPQFNEYRARDYERGGRDRDGDRDEVPHWQKRGSTRRHRENEAKEHRQGSRYDRRGSEDRRSVRPRRSGDGIEDALRKMAWMDIFESGAFGIPPHELKAAFNTFCKSLPTQSWNHGDAEEALSKGTFHIYTLNAFFNSLPKQDKTGVQVQELMRICDLRDPAALYPAARSIARKVYLHVGPTNSGKTHAALEALSKAESGMYCGPLRLLAQEVYERFNLKGIACNLVTGEERREREGVNRIACTVEMANLAKRVKVAVVDEIQMIGDEQRGGAWSNAVLGIPAEELHLCGEPSVVDLIKTMLKGTRDTIIVKEYERLSPLKVMDKSLNSMYRNLQPGDAIVTFSRKNIFALKKDIERTTKHKCAVIYGSLPPETRSEQARKFNEGVQYQLLIASDAIGMGLNLNVQRIVFERVEKFNGQDTKVLSTSQIKQIGGRAGRFGSKFSDGLVTTLDQPDLHLVKQAFQAPMVPVAKAGMYPALDVIEKFYDQAPDIPFVRILEWFEILAQVSGNYFLCNLDAQKQVAAAIEEYRTGLSIRDMYYFVLAPVDVRDTRAVQALSKMETFEFSNVIAVPTKMPKNADDLQRHEMTHKLVNLYLWLNLRFPNTFTYRLEAEEIKLRLEEQINEALAWLSMNVTEKRQRKA